MYLQWETIAQISTHDSTQRLMVPGGWLVCRLNGIHIPVSMASWFVSDPEHTWNLETNIVAGQE